MNKTTINTTEELKEQFNTVLDDLIALANEYKKTELLNTIILDKFQEMLSKVFY